jgi:hypothetical protein
VGQNPGQSLKPPLFPQLARFTDLGWLLMRPMV